MVQAIMVHRTGGPEVLELAEIVVPPPGSGEITLQQTFVGVNFGDTMQRSGMVPVSLPLTPGLDGVGVVTAVGEGVAELAVGDRACYTMLPGAYASVRNVPAVRAVKVPGDIDDATAVALISKGLTARYLLKDLRPIEPGEVILVHSAAGGVGSILSQWASALGIRVIGTVSSAAKVDFARANGCSDVVVRQTDDVAVRVVDITGGAKVSVVYDSVGLDTFTASLDSLRPRGLMVAYGATSGRVPPVALEELGRRGALMLTQPGLMPFIATAAQLAEASQDLWEAARNGWIKPVIERRIPLCDASVAHRELESGQSMGATLLEI